MELAGAILGAVAWFSQLGHRTEVGEWAGRAARRPTAPALAHAFVALWTAFSTPTVARARAEAVLETAPDGDAQAREWAWLARANACLYAGDTVGSLESYEAYAGAATSAYGRANGRGASALPLLYLGRVDEAIEASTDMVEIAAALKNPTLGAHARFFSGVARFAIEPRKGIDGLRRAAALAGEARAPFTQDLARVALANRLLGLGNPDTDEECAATIADLHRRFNAAMWSTVENVAIQLARRDDVEGAAVIVGHLRAHERRHAAFVAARAELETRIDADPAARGWLERGGAFDDNQTVVYVVDRLRRTVTQR